MDEIKISARLFDTDKSNSQVYFQEMERQETDNMIQRRVMPMPAMAPSRAKQIKKGGKQNG